MTVYGSHTKGYATEDSDFDGHIFVDVSQALANFNPDNITEHDLIENDEYQKIFESLPPIIPEESKRAYTISYLLNLKYQRAVAQTLGANVLAPKQLELVLLDDDYLSRCAMSDQEEDYASEHLISLFNLSLNPDISKFRRLVILNFKNQGSSGEQKWNELMKQLGRTERLENGEEELIGPDARPERHLKIYPSLDKAEEYFLIRD